MEYILNKAKDADAHVYVAAAVTKGLKSQEPCDWEALAKAGAIALSDDGRPVENTRFLADAMNAAPSLGLAVTAHCEDLYLAKGGIMHEGCVSRELDVPGIPAAAEDCGTARNRRGGSLSGSSAHLPCEYPYLYEYDSGREKARGCRYRRNLSPLLHDDP